MTRFYRSISMSLRLTGIAAATCCADSLGAQTLLSETTGPFASGYNGFGKALASGKDGRYVAALHPLTENGRVVVVDAATGTVLANCDSPAPYGSDFGAAVAGGIDFNCDGTNDVIVGSPAFKSPTNHVAGRVYLFSGATGLEIDSHEGGQDEHLESGRSVANVGDVDDDGIDDYAYGMPYKDVGTHHWAGRVKVRSGVTRDVLWHVDGQHDRESLGYRVYPAGDVDGDGHADVATYGPAPKQGTDIMRGRVRVFSGVSGAQLWTRVGGDFAFFGSSIAATRDWDGDSRGDLAVLDSGSGSVHIVNGDTGTDIVVIAPPMVDGAPATLGAVASGLFGAGSIYGADLLVHAPVRDKVLLFVRGAASTTPVLMSVTGSGQPNGDGFGRQIAVLGDVTGDALTGPGDLLAIAPEFAVSAQQTTPQGKVQVFSAGQYAHPCQGTSSSLPTLWFTGNPTTSLTLEARGGVPNAQVLLFFSGFPANLPVGAGCSLLVRPDFAPVVFAFDANGALDTTIPPFSGFLGAKVFTQLLTSDGQTVQQASNGYMLN
jgi:hypothetical protein